MKFSKTTTWHIKNILRSGVVVLVFAVIGIFALHQSHAATYATSAEAETGSLNGNVAPLSDGAASGGSGVQFGISSSGNTCALPNYPDASCTGVPAAAVATLTPYTGPTTISTANTVIDNKTINSCLTIRASGVIIKNSKVLCDMSSSNFVVFSDDEHQASASVTLMDTEVACTVDSGNSTALGSAFITALRVNIHGCENGFDINQNIDVEDSFIHDLFQSADVVLYPPDGTHTDGLQFGSGHFATPGNPNSLVSGTLNVTIKHNTIYSMAAGSPHPDSNMGDYTTSAIISNTGAIDQNILIQDNLLAGGAFSLYCEQKAKGVNYRVINNHFSTRFKSTVGFFGPSTECSDETQSGNVIHETGQPFPLD